MAGWSADVTPGAVIAALIVLVLGVPAIFIGALIGLATAIGAVVW